MKRPFTYSQKNYEDLYHTREIHLPDRDPAEYLDSIAKRGYLKREQEVWDALPIPVAGKVLEVACHAGKSGFWLLDRFPDITAMHMFDFSKVAVDFCRRYERHKDKTTIWQCDITEIGRPDGMFDWVNCVDVTEHLPEAIYRAALVEMFRVCKPGGHIILMAGNDKGCTEHIHIIHDSELVKDFQAAGWTQIAGLPHRHFLLRKPGGDRSERSVR